MNWKINNDGKGARLIATAPKLLEACRDTLTRLEWWEKDPATRSLDAAFYTLRQAIQAAEREDVGLRSKQRSLCSENTNYNRPRAGGNEKC